jgi:hypothetical protein
MRYGMGVFLACALGACGTSTSGMVGTWNITDGGGTETISCPGSGTTNEPITGEVLIVQGSSGNGVTSSSTIVATIDGNSETFTLTNATTASLESGGADTFPLAGSDGGALQTLTLTSDNIVVNGTNLSENASGTITGGAAGSCTFSRNISATQG